MLAQRQPGKWHRHWEAAPLYQPAEAATGLGAPAWEVPDMVEEANSQAGTVGGAPDKVPAEVPAPAKTKPRGGQTHVPAHLPNDQELRAP